jgi:choline dehydrogenase
LAQRVLFDQHRATGVEYRDGAGLHRPSCSGEVIVSAGAIASAKLLLLSGIGPAEDLAALGLPVVADRPQVGCNLQDHVYTTMVHEVSMPTLNRELSPLKALRHGLRFAMAGRGPASSGAAHAVAFLSLSEATAWPDLQITFGPFAFLAETAGGDGPVHDAHRIRPVPESAVTTMACLLHPRTSGSVRLRSADPSDSPVISFEAFTDPGDVDLLAQGCGIIRQVFATEPLASVVVKEMLPGPDVAGEAALSEHLRAKAWNGYHPVGTCRMGSDAASVVDPTLRVRGVEGLRVVDASVMPTLPSGNTNGPVVAIAERAARLIAEDGGDRP